MMGPISSRAPSIAARNGGLPDLHVPLDVLHHDDGVVDDQADREDDGEQRQQIDREARREHQERPANEGNRNRDDRNEDGAHGTEEQEDHDDDDEQRFAQGRQHLVDRVVDVLRRVVGDPDLHTRRQLRLNAGNLLSNPGDDVERVGGRQHPDAHECGAFAVEPHVLLVVLGAEHDVGDLTEPDDDALVFLDDELPELLRGPQVRVGDQVHRDHRSLGPSKRRQVVVAGERLADGGRRDAERRHPIRFQPDPHGERAVAEDIGPLHAADGAEPRLHHPHQVVGDLRLVEIG